MRTWKEVIALAQQNRFADMQVEMPQNIHTTVKRGPINRIYRDGFQIVIETIWTAYKDHSGEGWRNLNGTGMRVSDELRPTVDHEGTVTFFVPRLCKVQLFSTARPNSVLDPSQVSGLEAEDVRKSRAREYQLPLSSSWSDIVEKMRDWAGDGGVSAEDQIRIQEEARKSTSAA